MRTRYKFLFQPQRNPSRNGSTRLHHLRVIDEATHITHDRFDTDEILFWQRPDPYFLILRGDISRLPIRQSLNSFLKNGIVRSLDTPNSSAYRSEKYFFRGTIATPSASSNRIFFIGISTHKLSLSLEKKEESQTKNPALGGFRVPPTSHTRSISGRLSLSILSDEHHDEFDHFIFVFRIAFGNEKRDGGECRR